MQTRFSIAQLADPDIAEANRILRACVHCGFCTATCPTYRLTGDELDGPRGRIYLIKDMLETGGGAGDVVARHIDRCLSCLSCMTTCPSSVNYMHLVDHARRVIEETRVRPWFERAVRGALVAVLPDPVRFRRALALARFAARLAAPFKGLLPRHIGALLALAPARRPNAAAAEGRSSKAKHRASGRGRLHTTQHASHVSRPWALGPATKNERSDKGIHFYDSPARGPGPWVQLGPWALGPT